MHGSWECKVISREHLTRDGSKWLSVRNFNFQRLEKIENLPNAIVNGICANEKLFHAMMNFSRTIFTLFSWNCQMIKPVINLGAKNATHEATFREKNCCVVNGSVENKRLNSCMYLFDKLITFVVLIFRCQWWHQPIFLWSVEHSCGPWKAFDAESSWFPLHKLQKSYFVFT